jgi:hypothetical protein
MTQVGHSTFLGRFVSPFHEMKAFYKIVSQNSRASQWVNRCCLNTEVFSAQDYWHVLLELKPRILCVYQINDRTTAASFNRNFMILHYLILCF